MALGVTDPNCPDNIRTNWYPKSVIQLRLLEELTQPRNTTLMPFLTDLFIFLVSKARDPTAKIVALNVDLIGRLLHTFRTTLAQQTTSDIMFYIVRQTWPPSNSGNSLESSPKSGMASIYVVVMEL